MPKPNMLRSHLYRLLVCLSIITLLTGQAAAPANDPTPAPTATPPTPAQEKYADWAARPALSKDAPPEGESQQEGVNPEPSQFDRDCYSQPAMESYMGLVYSGVYWKDFWHEDIYFNPGVCGEYGDTVLVESNASSDFEPQLNSVANSIVFVSDRNSTSQATITNIYTIDIYGSNLKRLTNTVGQDRMPSYSPDGSKIVFVSARTGNAEIYVMDSSGGNQVRLTNSPDADVEPDWSPDGTRISWARRSSNGMGTIFVMNADGSNQHAILVPLPFAGRPRWSPSGSRLLLEYDAGANGWIDIAVVKADGSGFQMLALDEYRYAYTDLEVGGWLRDESGIVYGELTYKYYPEYDEWRILGTRLKLTYFTNLGYIRQITDGSPYTFDPHIRSMDSLPPSSSLSPLPEFSYYKNVPLRWEITDNFSFPYSFSVQASSLMKPEWVSFDGAIFRPSFSPLRGGSLYSGLPGDTVKFRTQSGDYAENVEPEKTIADAWTKLYMWLVSVNTLDVRERGLGGVQLLTEPAMMNEPSTNENGAANLYVANIGQYAFEFVKPGYATSPLANVRVESNQTITAVLTGLDEQLVNGHFDSNTPLESWQQSGEVDSTTISGRYGGWAARLGTFCIDSFCYRSAINLGAHIPQTPGAELAIDSLGQIHVRYEGNHYGIFDENGAIQPWPDLPVEGEYGPIQFSPDNSPYMIAEAKYIHWDGSAWTVDPAPFIQESMIQYEMDGLGQLHVLYNDLACGACLMYTRRSSDGTWLAPYTISTTSNLPASLAAEPNGKVHILYGQFPVTYRSISPNGTFSSVETLTNSPITDKIILKYFPSQGLFALLNLENIQGYVMKKQILDGSWVNVGGNSNFGWGLDLQTDAQENVYQIILRNNIPTVLKLSPDGSEFQEYFKLADVGPMYDFAIDPNSQIHLITGTGAGAQFQYQYRRITAGPISGIAAVEQPITLTEGMKYPTLSFFYRIQGGIPYAKSRFEVTFTPTDGEPVSLFSQQTENRDWQHVWVDLTPYLGMHGTLSFRLQQSVEDPAVFVSVDEASISSYKSPILDWVNPMPIVFPVPSDTWVEVGGGNIMEGARVFVDGSQITSVEWVDDTLIRFLAPEFPSIGSYLVSVVNPDGSEGMIRIRVGFVTHLPLLQR